MDSTPAKQRPALTMTIFWEGKMYFWRIENLKAEMASRSFSDREVLPYLLAYLGVSAAAYYLPVEVQNKWDVLGAIWYVLAVIFGTIYVYVQNGGSNGENFLQRYLVLGWVVAIRWMIFCIVMVVSLYAILTMLGIESEETTWSEFLLWSYLELFYYWRLAVHVRDLARRTEEVPVNIHHIE